MSNSTPPCFVAAKRVDKRQAGPEAVVNPFAAALASALGVEAPIGPGVSLLDDAEPPQARSQRVEMRFEKKGRKGKMATLLTFPSVDEDRVAQCAKRLKQSLGVGGSLEPDGVVLLQGDVRQKAEILLAKEGWTVKRIGG